MGYKKDNDLGFLVVGLIMAGAFYLSNIVANQLGINSGWFFVVIIVFGLFLLFIKYGK